MVQSQLKCIFFFFLLDMPWHDTICRGVECIFSFFLFFYFFFHCFFSSSGGWEKIKLKLTTLPRIFIRVVCRFISVAFATQR